MLCCHGNTSLFDCCEIFAVTYSKMRYSLEERCDLLEVFHQCNKNAAAARRLFIQIYPERPVPSETTFRKIEAKFRRQKSVADIKRTRQPRTATKEKQLEILLHFQENQRDSLRSAANILEVSKSTCSRMEEY